MEQRQQQVPEAPADGGAGALAQALRSEQRYVDGLYRRLDEERAAAEAALAEVHARGGDGGTRQNLVEREVGASEHAARLARLNSADSGLCFGRIDHADGEALYIGRIGLRGPEHDPLLIDWRAPAARPFYAASPSAPGTVVRRRHLHSAGRALTGIDDEVFDAERLGERERRELVGEAALLAALRRGRTGRMTDVVATIQSEQDRVIRSGLPGALVVQGGPGTGKTVAALHRAAFLLYTHRATLARRGVLIVGPNAVFLRYIGEVLPSLGETDVVLTTLGGLFPGVRAAGEDSPECAVVKGDPRMAEVVAGAVALHQRDPEGELAVPVEDFGVVTVPRAACVRARERAQALGDLRTASHHLGRKRFVTDLLAALVRARAEAVDRPLDEEELRYGPGELWRQPAVREAIDALWPPLTPQRLVARLLTDPGLLRDASRAAGGLLTEEEQAALLRPPGRAREWTVGDVPLLDEAAELLGEDDSAQRARERAAQAEREDELRYAQGVLQILDLEESGVDPVQLATAHTDQGPVRSTADRAAADRGWAYGHVIVDEAQELSPMAWRTVMRRVPGRSMTIVGDVAQTGSPAGARSWAQVLDPYLRGRWREERLTVNYRTPSEVMEPAARVLAEVAPEQEPPESVRAEGVAPRTVRARPGSGGLTSAVAGAVAEELAGLRADGGGRLAVIAPYALLPALAAALPEAAADERARGGADGGAALDAEVVLLGVAGAKGLEFDRVVLAEPAAIVDQSPNGGHDLYVAITRVTRRLTVVHGRELPAALRG